MYIHIWEDIIGFKFDVDVTLVAFDSNNRFKKEGRF
jgi:hypothetical protein